ncbi:MAG: dienelactone hydrolase family protein [Candidatus Limnocylindrales bacterium]
MCHEADSHPPLLPADLRPAPMAGGALETHEPILVASDGNRLRAFEARAPQPRGGIVIFPDWRGLGQFYEELAMRFAEAGYDAVAFDYFGRTAGTAPHPADFDNLPHVAQTTPAGVAADAAAAADHLRAGERFRALAVLGFCFGGRNALLQGLPDSSIGPEAIVSFYGQLGPDRSGQGGPLAVADRFVRPVLGHYGGADESIPVEQVEQFGQVLAAHRVPHEIYVYPGATHSFFDQRRAEFAAEAEQAWHRTLAFLDRTLGPAGRA